MLRCLLFMIICSRCIASSPLKIFAGMGWEWRAFFHGDLRGNFQNHINSTMPNLLNCYPSGEAEERYDVYACIEESVGYKVRGDERSELLEVKTRLERKKRGAEQWQKVAISCVATRLS